MPHSGNEYMKKTLDIDRMSAATAKGQGLITDVIRVRLDVAVDEAFLSSLPGAAKLICA
jgi:hypothetical protein